MIILKSSKYVVLGVLKKTKAKFFSSIKANDIIDLSMKAVYPGRGRSGLYVPGMTFFNYTTNEVYNGTLSDVKYLECFDLDMYIERTYYGNSII